jgi:hypothetical protein
MDTPMASCGCSGAAVFTVFSRRMVGERSVNVRVHSELNPYALRFACATLRGCSRVFSSNRLAEVKTISVLSGWILEAPCSRMLGLIFAQGWVTSIVIEEPRHRPALITNARVRRQIGMTVSRSFMEPLISRLGAPLTGCIAALIYRI